MASVLKAADASKMNTNSQNCLFEMTKKKISLLRNDQMRSAAITNINIGLIFLSREINAKLGECQHQIHCIRLNIIQKTVERGVNNSNKKRDFSQSWLPIQ